MAHKKGFQIDPRVAIAMDALPSTQKISLKRVLHDKDRFIAYASVPGRTQKISATRPLYKMKVGSSGLRVIFSQVDDAVLVMDVMHKKTMDQFGGKKTKEILPKKGITPVPAKKAAATKAHKS
jgi:hypothetical protein